MKRKSYILVKTGEESAEVAQAAMKHLLHGSKETQANLEQEIGDLLAFVVYAQQRGIINKKAVDAAMYARIERENIKGKA